MTSTHEESTPEMLASPTALQQECVQAEKPDSPTWPFGVSWFLFTSGIMTALVGTIMFRIATFNASVLWGVGCIMLPPIVGLIFLVKHWPEARKSFYAQLAGMAMIAASLAVVAPYWAALMSR